MRRSFQYKPDTFILETSKAPDLYNYNKNKMIGREIALEALGALCGAEVIVVDQSDGYRDSFGSGSEGAELSSIHQLHHQVLEADQRR